MVIFKEQRGRQEASHSAWSLDSFSLLSTTKNKAIRLLFRYSVIDASGASFPDARKI